MARIAPSSCVRIQPCCTEWQPVPLPHPNYLFAVWDLAAERWYLTAIFLCLPSFIKGSRIPWTTTLRPLTNEISMDLCTLFSPYFFQRNACSASVSLALVGDIFYFLGSHVYAPAPTLHKPIFSYCVNPGSLLFFALFPSLINTSFLPPSLRTFSEVPIAFGLIRSAKPMAVWSCFTSWDTVSFHRANGYLYLLRLLINYWSRCYPTRLFS